jgi:nitrate/TMAO reductase-like tetraheme cytochrome c subunit
MSRDVKRPFITLLTSHWISMLGVALATTAGFSWLFVLPQHLRGNVSNPYIGILIFMVIPAILFLGLALIPIGIFLARRRIAAGLSAIGDRRTAWRRLGIFFGLMTFVNLLIGSQATYRAVQHMDTQQFCGQSCHVMKPEFTAWKHAPHSHVECVDCHLAPGASGWFAAKMSGTRQLMAVVLNSYPRPIESAMESNRLVSSADTCGHCHNPELEIGSPMKIVSSYKDDETNTSSQTVLMMLVGGRTSGIHGAHLGPGVQIRYAAADAKRQTIPWVEYKGADGKTQTFVAAGAKGTEAMPKFEMQCVDCHTRPAHSFQLASRAVDEALASGKLPAALPFLKKNAVEILRATYATDEAAAHDIPGKLDAFYKSKYPVICAKNTAEIAGAGDTLVALYRQNVFSDLKVTWGTYVNNLGHTDSQGCFRCHDEGHTATGGKTITQDCSVCHQMVAVDEASPEVLKTLGIADRMSALRKTH